VVELIVVDVEIMLVIEEVIAVVAAAVLLLVVVVNRDLVNLQVLHLAKNQIGSYSFQQISILLRRLLNLREQKNIHAIISIHWEKSYKKWNFLLEKKEFPMYQQIQMEFVAQQNQALTIATLQNTFSDLIAFEQCGVHTPEYRYIEDHYEKEKKSLKILQVYRYYHQALYHKDSIEEKEEEKLYAFAVADEDEILSILQTGSFKLTNEGGKTTTRRKRQL
jgi:hypothetical protein